MKRVAALLTATALFLAPVPVRAEPDPAPLTAVVAKVSPSVVGISVVQRVPSEEPGEPPHLIFASGSGFAIRTGGYILSNAHVLDHALAARITTADGKSYAVNPSNIWADSVSDLAVAKVEADLPPITWADSKKAAPGDPVFAMGSPYGLRFQGSVSRGIISGLNRSLGAEYPFLQTDAPINPGNSGGPLFNTAGEVLGVNSRGIPSGDGMGFAIPADVAREIADRLIKDGKVERAWLGVRLDDQAEADLTLGGVEGPGVTMVEPGTPAEKAGLQVGDTLTALDRKPVKSIEDVSAFLRAAVPGAPVTATWKRGDLEMKAELTLVTRPPDTELEYRNEGLWLNLTAAQQERARLHGKAWSVLGLDDLTGGWTTHVDGARATLYTEYLSLTRLSWEAARDGKTVSPERLAEEARKVHGLVTVEIDLPTRFRLGSGDAVWAQWQDQGGMVKAFDVQVLNTAPAGFQRVQIRFRADQLAKTGPAVVILHLDEGNNRRFLFDLSSVH